MKKNVDFCCYLENRDIIEIHGNDRESFLQGIITQDVRCLEKEPILYSLLLSPQGKFQFDFFIIQIDNNWFIDIDSSCTQAFMKRLQLFKLHSDVNIKLNKNRKVGVSSAKLDLQSCFFDPRLKNLGYRFYEAGIVSETSNDNYEILRLSLGVPDGAQDMIFDKSIPLEWGMDELNAISWSKGCYMGQELTARSRYVGQIRKRVFPVTFEVANNYNIGDKLCVDSQEIGELRAVNGGVGIALLKLDFLHENMFINGYPIKVNKPDWMIIN